jgi:hypothetical protein
LSCTGKETVGRDMLFQLFICGLFNDAVAVTQWVTRITELQRVRKEVIVPHFHKLSQHFSDVAKESHG